MTLACGVLGVLVDRTGLVKVIRVAPTILRVESRFDLDLALHVAGCYVSGIAQAKRHTGGRRSRARTLGALTDFDCIGDHIPDTIDPSDQVAWSEWVGFLRQICFDLLVGGDRIAFDDEARGWSSGCCRHRAKVDDNGVGEEFRHALREDDDVGRSHRVARRTLTLPLRGMPTVRW
jgi:hypothetical protein